MSHLKVLHSDEEGTSYSFTTTDRQEAMRCLKSGDAFGSLWEMQHRVFRNLLKHPTDKEKEFDIETIEYLQFRFQEILDENNINFEECYS